MQQQPQKHRACIYSPTSGLWAIALCGNRPGPVRPNLGGYCWVPNPVLFCATRQPTTLSEEHSHKAWICTLPDLECVTSSLMESHAHRRKGLAPVQRRVLAPQIATEKNPGPNRPRNCHSNVSSTTSSQPGTQTDDGHSRWGIQMFPALQPKRLLGLEVADGQDTVLVHDG